MRLSSIISGLLVFFSFSLSADGGEKELRVQGKIIESGSSRSVRGATISIQTGGKTKTMGTSNDLGHFDIPIDWEEVGEGKVWLIIERKGFAPIKVEITRETQGPINIRMERVAPRLPILVPPGNQPPPGVIIVNQSP